MELFVKFSDKNSQMNGMAFNKLNHHSRGIASGFISATLASSLNLL